MESVVKLFQSGFVVVDVETTGFVSDHVRIVEVAVVDHLGQVLVNTLVNPECHIPSGASAVHGIYDVDVAEASTFADIYPQLATVLNGTTAVAYNHTFEIGIFKSVCKQYAVEYFNSKWFCAMRNYATYANRRKWMKLGNAARREGIVVKNAHRALGDCIMTLELLKRMGGQP